MALVSIELWSTEARVVIALVEIYLKYAEAIVLTTRYNAGLRLMRGDHSSGPGGSRSPAGPGAVPKPLSSPGRQGNFSIRSMRKE